MKPILTAAAGCDIPGLIVRVIQRNKMNKKYYMLVLVTKSCPTLVTPWTIAHQAPLPMGFIRQEYWSGLPFPSVVGRES